MSSLESASEKLRGSRQIECCGVEVPPRLESGDGDCKPCAGQCSCGSKNSQAERMVMRATIAAFKTSARQISAAAARKSRGSPYPSTTPGQESQTEIDSRADTCVLGANFTAVSFTGQTCDVTPFKESYEPERDVPIASAATAFDNPETGETVMLMVNEGLWFGDTMSHSLLNPNQCRLHGIDLCDDPFDKYRSLGIVDPDTNLNVPFTFEQCAVGFTSRAPTPEEIEEARRSGRLLVLTSDEPWDPSTATISNVRIAARSKEEENLHEYDVLLRECSAIYTEKSMLTRMISNVNVFSYTDQTIKEELRKNRAQEVVTETRHTTVTAEQLARKWGIGIEAAKATLKATTQYGVRHAIHPLSRRYRTDIMLSHLRRLATTVFTDTMFGKIKSLKGNTCGQIFSAGKFVHFEPMVRKSSAGDKLNCFFHEVGVPERLVFDGAKEQCGPESEFMKSVRREHIDWRVTEPYAHWQNKAEGQIREVRKKWRRMKAKMNVPARLWDYGVAHACRIMNLTARGPDFRTGYEEMLGETPDISEYVDFEFYDWVTYWDVPGEEDNPKLGRWLGVSNRVGSRMCYWVLPITGEPISRSAVQNVPREERQQQEMKDRMNAYTEAIDRIMNDPAHQLNNDEPFYIDDIDDEEEEMEPVVKWEEDADIYPTPDTYDEYIGMRVFLPQDDGKIAGTVTKRLRGDDGRPIGRRNDNPILDTRKYEVQLSDGTTEEFYANSIAENMFAQVDSEGHEYELLEDIVDHKKDGSAIGIEDGYFTTRSGRKRRKRTTRGWKLLVQWKTGTTDWIPLSQLKESNPIETAEYAKSNKLEEEPAFAWWINDVLRKRNRIISKVKSRYWKQTHKFGIELPKTVAEAYAIDKKTGTNHWTKAIEKEMSKIRGMDAFERYDKATVEDLRSGKAKLPGFTEIGCHMIFDVKMDGKFTRKARLVANGNETKDISPAMTYSTVVSRESVRIAFLHAALNDLDVLGCDVSNAYLNAPCREKLWYCAGPEFGSEEGTVMILRRAVYGTKAAGKSWRTMLAQTIEDMGYVNTIVDPDVYRRPATKPNGYKYYEMLLVYVDDILVVSGDPYDTMDKIGQKYDLKDTVKPPDRYLGANIMRWNLRDGREVWAMSGKDYVKNSVQVVKDMLHEDGLSLKVGKPADRPMPKTYHPELDVSPLLEGDLCSRYHQLIGMLRWAVELGRIDILLEVSLMSSYLASPREGHLEMVYNIFAYIGKHEESQIVLDDYAPEMNEEAFERTDWSESIYGDVSEEIPPNAPEPRGKAVTMTCFVDANHAGEHSTRRSHTGFLIFLNNAPIDWYSKKQNTVESSTFGSEFVAMRIAVERIKALRIKLRMFGIPIDGPTNVLGDNESVVNAASKIEAKLNKKHNAICFHAVREASAAGFVRVGWEPTESNLADLFTKMLPTDQRRKLMSCIFTKGM